MSKRKREEAIAAYAAQIETYTYKLDGHYQHTRIKRAAELVAGDRTDYGVVWAAHVRRNWTYLEFKQDEGEPVRLKPFPPDYRIAYTADGEPIHFVAGSIEGVATTDGG